MLHMLDQLGFGSVYHQFVETLFSWSSVRVSVNGVLSKTPIAMFHMKGVSVGTVSMCDCSRCIWLPIGGSKNASENHRYLLTRW
jgi:hypothetical protein